MTRLRLAIAATVALTGPLVGATNAQGATVTLQGQVVCSECWYEADRAKTPYGSEADVECAARCAKNGIPQALAVDGEGAATLYVLEVGKISGPAGGWLDYIGRRVEVTGTVYVAGKKSFVKVDSLKVLGEAPTGEQPKSETPPSVAPEGR